MLKARQKGISKVIDADQLVECIRKEGTNSVVISHEKNATKRLFNSVRSFINLLEKKPVTSIDSQSEIRFPSKQSSYFIGTAGQRAFGRGDTIHRAHLSEAAFYPDLENILNGVAEAAEFGQIDVETTANGRGAFYDAWQKAKAGKSSFTNIFIPWFIDQEYSIDNLTSREQAGLSKSVQEMISIPDAEFELQPDEKALIARAKTEFDKQITIGMIKWRRYKIWDKGEIFFQEYPEDDISCFLQSGRSVFTQIVLDPSRKIPLDDLDSGHVPDEEKVKLKNRRLYGGLDGAAGKGGGDNHSFAVIDIDPITGKAAVIFDITNDKPIDVFDRKVADICEQFDIFLNVESNGIGQAHVNKLRELGVNVQEVAMDGVNRPVLVSDLEEAYRKANLIESYEEAESEARDMEYDSKNKADHKQGKHNDRVFARILAWAGRNLGTAGVEFI